MDGVRVDKRAISGMEDDTDGDGNMEFAISLVRRSYCLLLGRVHYSVTEKGKTND